MLNDKSNYPRLPISQLRKKMAQSLEKAFADHGYSVTNEQELVLRNLVGCSSISQTELAGLIGQDRNNLSRTLTILERKGYVKKENSDEDRRYCRISITQEGEQAHEKLLGILEEWRLLFFKDIPVEDLRKFKETAEKLIANLEDMKK